jgi:putative transcriptional regulator
MINPPNKNRQSNMSNKPKFKSDAFEAIHSTAQGLYKANAIDKNTMREFDESCLLVPAEFEPVREEVAQ